MFLQLTHAGVTVPLDRIERIEPQGQNTMVQVNGIQYTVLRGYSDFVRLLTGNRIQVLSTEDHAPYTAPDAVQFKNLTEPAA